MCVHPFVRYRKSLRLIESPMLWVFHSQGVYTGKNYSHNFDIFFTVIKIL